jgi:hypothetical protein
MRRRRDLLASATVLLVAGAFACYRRWHLGWGASRDERDAAMVGDEVLPVAQFTATRAITIGVPPSRVWPWLTQVGVGRAGFYSYDLIDNRGRRSSGRILPQFQQIQVGDVAAPMTDHPSATTSFRVASFRPGEALLWSKPDSTWAWQLTRRSDGTTRLVTRLKVRYRATLAGIGTIALIEVGDFPMMRKMLRGIKRRAESTRDPDHAG